MGKSINIQDIKITEIVDKSIYSVCRIQDGDLILWDGKNFRNKDGSKYPIELDTEGMPDRYLIGWMQEWKAITKKVMKFAALDLPETRGTFEQRQKELDVIWRGSTTSIMYLVAPSPVENNVISIPCLGFITDSKWTDKEWAFHIHE